jgi:hypothetical protein
LDEREVCTVKAARWLWVRIHYRPEGAVFWEAKRELSWCDRGLRLRLRLRFEVCILDVAAVARFNVTWSDMCSVPASPPRKLHPVLFFSPRITRRLCWSCAHSHLTFPESQKHTSLQCRGLTPPPNGLSALGPRHCSILHQSPHERRYALLIYHITCTSLQVETRDGDAHVI